MLRILCLRSKNYRCGMEYVCCFGAFVALRLLPRAASELKSPRLVEVDAHVPA